MCNCLSETIQRVKSELPEKNRTFANLNITNASFDNECIIFESGVPTQLCYPITIKHDPIGRKKQTTINMLGSFCPFCGEAIKKGAEELARGEKAEVSA
jgi:hypothetical protein